MKKEKEKILEDSQIENNETNINENIELILEENDKEISTTNEESPQIDDEQTDKKDNSDSTKNVIDKLTNKNNMNKKIIIPIILVFIVLLLIFSTIFALLNFNNNKIISGITIKGIDVSGLTKEEAYDKISNIIQNKLSTPFDLIHGDSITTIIPEQFEANFDIESSINTAYERGRGNNIFKSNFEILSCLLYKVNIVPSFSYNEEAINSLITEIQSNLPDRLIEPNYYIDGSNLIITKGIDGKIVKSEILKLKIISNINNFYSENEDIEIPTEDSIAKSINIDTIHSEIYKEAKDAYYTSDPFTVYPHVEGIDFNISIDEAKQMLEENKESYSIALKITTPAVTTNDIGTEAFPDLLATYSTTFSTKNVNRSTNIRLASSKINGIVLMPGETFSYNTTVGKRTAAAGFKSAAVYVGGEVTTGIGGGICQVSSTLYNSVLLSNLEIVERYNHGFNPGYVPAGRDATVSWGGPDFKFKNNRNYPIKVICTVSGGTIITKIFGLKEQSEYEVEIQSYITSYISYKTITKEDATLAKGTTKVIANGSNGCRSVAYRILKQNGQIISKTLLSKDTYNPHNKIVAVGTK